MKNYILIIAICIQCISINIFAGENDTTELKQKKGWGFGAFPILGFDADVGFQYGAIASLYHYGDGTIFPNYKSSIYLEFSRSTKGSGTNQLSYDSGILFEGFRISSDLAYLTEQTLDFFGFNGYESEYNTAFTEYDNPYYISNVYYKHKRELLRFTTDFQYKIKTTNLWLVAGFGIYQTDIATVNIDKLNKGRNESEILPDTNTLYDNYIDWGIISSAQKNGGNTNQIKLGFIYDSRDNEANPMKGLWSEIFLQTAPAAMGNDFSYSQLIITHRQYITLLKNKINFAYRIGYQTKLSGEIPFYMLPFVYYSNRPTRDGLGGSRTLRGIKRNRVIGDGFVYANFGIRWKFIQTTLFNQNIYLALNPFADMGTITQKYKYSTSNIPETIHIIEDEESLHLSYGMGLDLAINENFILCF
ncbi:MAG: hypothetical protein B7C24_07815, partial [Bacteroidetes bacterium 4572_77]